MSTYHILFRSAGRVRRFAGRAGVAAALAGAAVLLAACAAEPTVTVQPGRSGPPIGIDMATDASDVLNQLKSSRLAFVARYYRDPASRFPSLTPSEAQRLSSLGINIVAVWETHSHKPEFFTYASGYNDALAAHSQARAVGQPPGSAIYFAVDFDARGEALAAVQDYFRGVSAGLAAAGRGRPVYKVGVYGSGAVCSTVKRAGLAQYSWLSNSTAWSGTLAYSGWDIRQTARWPDLAFDHDGDEARSDYGGFRLASSQIAAPYAAASAAQPQPRQTAASAPPPQATAAAAPASEAPAAAPPAAEIAIAAASPAAAANAAAPSPAAAAAPSPAAAASSPAAAAPPPEPPASSAEAAQEPQQAEWLRAIRRVFAL